MLIVTELTLYLDHDCQSGFCKLAIFCFLVTVYTLRKYSNTHKKPSSAYNKNENQFFAYKQQRQQKTSQWIIRGDEIQRKPSLHTHTHRCWSTPTLIFPYSQPYLQVTYGCMQSEPPPLSLRWAAQSFITLRESVSVIYSAEQDAACFNSCPVVTQASASHTQFSIHCSLM